MPNQPHIDIACVGNIYSRMMHFLKTGDIEIGHTHQFDHITFLAHGSLRVTVNGQTTDFKAPKMIFIHKDEIHELVALEDNTVACCIHGLRAKEGTGDFIDPSGIPLGVDIMSLAQQF